MNSNKMISDLNKIQVTIAPYSVLTVDFDDFSPNYFRVQNSGDSYLYCSTSHIPTADNHDFSVKPLGMKTFTEPYTRRKLYIFNPSGTEIHATVLYFYTEFDPVVLAISDSDMDLGTLTMKTETEIDAINTPLPSGSNLIGVVGVQAEVSQPLANLPAIKTATENTRNNSETIKNDLASVLTKLNILMAEAEQEGYTNLATVVANAGGSGSGSGGSSTWTAEDINYLLERIHNTSENSTTNINSLSTIIQDLATVKSRIESMGGWLNTIKTNTAATYGTQYGETVLDGTNLYSMSNTAAGNDVAGGYWDKIIFLSNDSENDIDVYMDSGKIVKLFTLKAGEVLNDVPYTADALYISGPADSAVRCLVSVKYT